jgi:hypothetical protein
MACQLPYLFEVSPIYKDLPNQPVNIIRALTKLRATDAKPFINEEGYGLSTHRHGILGPALFHVLRQCSLASCKPREREDENRNQTFICTPRSTTLWDSGIRRTTSFAVTTNILMPGTASKRVGLVSATLTARPTRFRHADDYLSLMSAAPPSPHLAISS